MALNIEYFRKIQNSNGVDSKKELQINKIKDVELKHFYDTHGTENVDILTSNYDGYGKLITINQDIIIVDKNDVNIKKIISKPNETFHLGDIVFVYDTKYIITDIDARDTIHTVAQMERCNLVIKWQDKSGKLHESIGICTDLSGIGIEESKLINIAKSESKIILPLNKDTILLESNKRIMIGLFDGTNNDANSKNKEYRDLMIENKIDFPVYKLINSNKIENIYEGYGYISYVYTEDQFNSETDRVDLMLCDYVEVPEPIIPIPSENGYSVISYSGNPELKIGGNYKKFTVSFYNKDGTLITNKVGIWTYTIDNKYKDYIQVDNTLDSTTNTFKIKSLYCSELTDITLTLCVSDEVGNYKSSIGIKFVHV